MAEEEQKESPFLKYQDVNGDGLIDACEAEFNILPPAECPDCVPNATAIVPDWTQKDLESPFLNERLCMYQITAPTSYKTTFGDALPIGEIEYSEAEIENLANQSLEEIYEEYIYTAIEALLKYYDKSTVAGIQMQVYDMMQKTDWNLSLRSSSHLKLLYSVPSEEFEALPDAPADEDEDNGDVEVTYAVEELLLFNIQVRKALWMYARSLTVMRKVENSNILFLTDNSVFNLDLYGDFGLSPNASKLATLIEELDSFLNSRKINIQGVGSFSGDMARANRTAERLTFSFKDRDLIRLTIEAAGCQTDPITFTDKLSILKKSGSAWRDKTAVNYFMNLREMDTDITASEPTPWIDFILEYTYPPVYKTANSMYDNGDQARSCLGASLAAESKQLGEDILNPIFSLGDAIAYQFHKQKCAKTQEELMEIKKEMLIYLSPKTRETSSLRIREVSGSAGPVTEEEYTVTSEQVQASGVRGRQEGQSLYGFRDDGEATGKIKALAKEQAFGEIDPDEEQFSNFCVWLFGLPPGEPGQNVETSLKTAKNFYTQFRGKLDRLKMCGLLDLLTEGIQCLFSGLSLEQALSKMIEAALKGMSVKSLSDLFLGLPVDKRQQIENLAKKKLLSGEIFEKGTENEAAMNQEEGDLLSQEQAQQQTATAAVEAGLEDITSEFPEIFSSEASAALSSTPTAADSTLAGVASASSADTAKHDWVSSHEGNLGGLTFGDWTNWKDENRNTLAPSHFAALKTITGGLDPNKVVVAYIQAIIEVYVGDEFSLIDLLGKFPGAPIISNIIAGVTCPGVPYFNPSTLDYMVDWQLPICRNNKDITFPTLMLPPRHKFTDLWLFLKNAVKLAMAQLIQKILVSLMVRLCKTISNRSCNALGIAGQLAKNLATGENTLVETIKKSICGDSVDDQTLHNTVTDLFESFGNGSGAFSDSDTVMDFAMDISSAVTQDEMSEAFLGEASEEFTTVVIELCNNEYPQYASAFGDPQTIKKTFGNMGNVMPVDFRDQLRNGLGEDGADTPSNPTLCATDEDLEQFCENRAALMEGRASPGQIKKMCDDFQNNLLEELGDIAPIMNDFPGYVQNNMPPLVSDPGCDNGILPYEPELVQEAVVADLDSKLEQVRLAYTQDMLGSGPGKKNWGLLNLILSDTMGQPLSTHHRKTSNQERRVDFYKNWTIEELKPELEEVLINGIGSIAAFATNPVAGIASLIPLINSLPRPIEQQRGAYPMYVSSWLREQINNLSFEYSINNDLPSNYTNEYYRTNFEDLPGYRSYNRQRVNFLSLPDLGYNIQIDPYYADTDAGSSGYVEFVKLTRKSAPDLTLQYRDNAKGVEDYEFSYGYDIETYFADLASTPSGTLTPKKCIPSEVSNRAEITYINEEELTPFIVAPSDSTRIKIYNILNPYADLDNAEMELLDPVQQRDIKKERYDGASTIKERAFEFMAVDQTFVDINFDPYPKFLDKFSNYEEDSPLLTLLEEILMNAGWDSLSTGQSSDDLKQFHSSVLETLNQSVANAVYENEPMWLYGASYDRLTMDDAEYVIPDNTPYVPEEYWGGPYQEAEIEEFTTTGEESGVTGLSEMRKIKNDDMILGVSKMQYKIEKGEYELQYVSDSPSDYDTAITTPAENRVFYLDPALYGGNYMNPPVYIKPMANKGWLGLIENLFPEISVCKDSPTDFVDFQDIQDQLDETYKFLSDDPRWYKDPECRIEVPFNKLLKRDSKAFIYGLVDAAIRIYVSAHIIKSLPIYTIFAPKYPDCYSNITAAYILEIMEKSFKDAQGTGAEAFNTFKDEEFWYSFLEQAVECFASKVENDLIEPSPSAESAMARLNKLQEKYEFVTKEDLKQAKEEQKVGRIKLLKNYRSDKNLEEVQEYEEDCKIILQEMIATQMNLQAEKVINNLKGADEEPAVKNMDYYILDNFTAGSSLTLNEKVNFDGSFETSYPDFPEVPFEENEETEEPYYTDGGQFVVGEKFTETGPGVGEEYIGYYHVHIDLETGQLKFMAGEYHSIETHDLLTPVVNLVKIPIGDVPEYGERSVQDSLESIDKPFLVEKYISINGQRHAPTAAVDIVKGNDSESLISEIYPGTMALNADETGIVGELGVRYGLTFSLLLGGSWFEITSVEIDALDRPIKQFTTLGSDSALLLCLINHLKKDDVFRLITGYVFPIRKIASIMSIYVDMGLLASIGEVTVADGATYQKTINPLSPFNAEGKPGMYASTETGTDDDGNTVIKSITIDGIPGWASKKDRNVWSPFFLEFDEWDQEILRSTKSKIKRLFKYSYNSRDFSIPKMRDYNIVNLRTESLKNALRLPQGDRILPRFRRKRLSSNPFNSLGQECESEENEE